MKGGLKLCEYNFGEHIVVHQKEIEHLKKESCRLFFSVYNILFNLMCLPLLKQLQTKVGLLLCCRETLTQTKLNTSSRRESQSRPRFLKTTMQRNEKMERQENMSGCYSFVVSIDGVCANEESPKQKEFLKRKLKLE